MSTKNLIRWNGLISLSAGLLYALGALLHPVGEGLIAIDNPNWISAHLIYWVSILLMHLGLVGIFARQAKHMGWLGLIGFVLAFVGTALVGSIVLVASTILPVIAANSPEIFDLTATLPDFLIPVFVLGFGLGWILFGFASMRAGILPRWSGLLVAIGVTLFVISEAIPLGTSLAHILVTGGDLIFGLGLVWMGYALWSEKRETEDYGKSATRLSAS